MPTEQNISKYIRRMPHLVFTPQHKEVFSFKLKENIEHVLNSNDREIQSIFNKVPGQWCVLHFFVVYAVSGPHDLPPYRGGIHVRVRTYFMEPVPHGLEHELTDLQLDHGNILASTEESVTQFELVCDTKTDK